MSDGCIRITRERQGFSVTVDDPEIQAANDKARGSDGPYSWKDPSTDFDFETKDQVLAFLEAAIDKALPADTYSSAFDKIAKEAMQA